MQSKPSGGIEYKTILLDAAHFLDVGKTLSAYFTLTARHFQSIVADFHKVVAPLPVQHTDVVTIMQDAQRGGHCNLESMLETYLNLLPVKAGAEILAVTSIEAAIQGMDYATLQTSLLSPGAQPFMSGVVHYNDTFRSHAKGAELDMRWFLTGTDADMVPQYRSVIEEALAKATLLNGLPVSASDLQRGFVKAATSGCKIPVIESGRALLVTDNPWLARHIGNTQNAEICLLSEDTPDYKAAIKTVAEYLYGKNWRLSAV